MYCDSVASLINLVPGVTAASDRVLGRWPEMGGVHLIDSTSKSKAAVSKILLGEYDRVFVAVKQVLFEQPGKNGMSKKLSMTRKFNRPLSRRLDRCDRVIQNESRDPFGGKVYYVTMQITFLTRANSGMGNVICIVT